MISRRTDIFTPRRPLNDETRYAIRARSHQYAKISSATYAFCESSSAHSLRASGLPQGESAQYHWLP